MFYTVYSGPVTLHAEPHPAMGGAELHFPSLMLYNLGATHMFFN